MLGDHCNLARGETCISSYIHIPWDFSVSSVQLFMVSDSLWPHGLQHARLPCLSPTPRACSNSCQTLCNPMNCSPPGSSVHGILQARILKWVIIPSSRGSSQLGDQTCVSCIAGGFFTIWVTRESLANPSSTLIWFCPVWYWPAWSGVCLWEFAPQIRADRSVKWAECGLKLIL